MWTVRPSTRGRGMPVPARRPERLHELDLEGVRVRVRVREDARARRMILRVDPARDEAVLVLPRGISPDDGIRFVRGKAGWLLPRLARVPDRVAFVPGAVVPVLGVAHAIRHAPERRTVVSVEDGEIVVAGSADAVERRVAGWFRVEARRQLARRAHTLAERLPATVARITVRDTRSRWGSCTPAGALSFSWRLILAPEPVLDYVVAHEVAHLVEMNHGARFWRLVAGLCPDHAGPRGWLREHGAGLHRYG